MLFFQSLRVSVSRVAVAAVVLALFAGTRGVVTLAQTPAAQVSDAEAARFVDGLLGKMTLEEKIGQMSQIALEQKVEENTGTLKRDMQKLTYTVRGFMDNVTDAIAGITVRLDMHKDTPINEAHPHSAA